MYIHKCVTVPCKNRLFHHILLASLHSKCCIAGLSLRWKHTCFKGEGTHLQRCRISPCNLATPLKAVGQHSDGCNQSTRRLIFKLCTRLQHIHVVHRQFDCLLYSSNGWSPLASHFLDCWLWVSVGCVALVHAEFVVQRAEKFGGTVRFTTYKELAEAYAKEEVYPLDLKNAVATELNKVSCSLIPRPL